MRYGVDYIDGVEVPQLVISEDYVIQGKHSGTIHVEGGELIINGEVNGTLCVYKDASVVIYGKQNGTVSIESGAKVVVVGELNGTTTINNGSTVTVEEKGKLAGTLSNSGRLIVRGVFGGEQSGQGEIILEGNGQIKRPIVKNGISYYQW